MKVHTPRVPPRMPDARPARTDSASPAANAVAPRTADADGVAGARHAASDVLERTQGTAASHTTDAKLAQALFSFLGDAGHAGPAELDRAAKLAEAELAVTYGLTADVLHGETTALPRVGQLAAQLVRLQRAAHTAMDALHTELSALQDAGAHISRAFESGDLAGLVRVFDADVVNAQRTLGQSDDQFLMEALGLRGDWRTTADSAFPRMAAIDDIFMHPRPRLDGDDAFATLTGTAVLHDGTHREVSVRARADGGRYVLTAAVG